MINQYNSGGAVASANPLAGSQAYANGLSKYSPKGAKTSPMLSVAGSAIGTMAQMLSANPKLAKEFGDRLGKYFGGTETSIPSAESFPTIPMQAGGGY